MCLLVEHIIVLAYNWLIAYGLLSTFPVLVELSIISRHKYISVHCVLLMIGCTYTDHIDTPFIYKQGKVVHKKCAKVLARTIL